MKKIILLFAGLLIAGCNDGGSGSGSAAQKSLFSVWTRTDLQLSFDFSNANFGTSTMTWTIASGEKCNSTLGLSGSESSGNYSLSNSTYVPGTGSGHDPGCSTLNEVGTYSKSGNTLSICTNGTTCGTYK